jgi:hypothetical protein
LKSRYFRRLQLPNYQFTQLENWRRGFGLTQGIYGSDKSRRNNQAHPRAD